MGALPHSYPFGICPRWLVLAPSRPLSGEQSSLTRRSISLNEAQSCADNSWPGIARGQNTREREGQRRPPDSRSIVTAEHKKHHLPSESGSQRSAPCSLHRAARGEDLMIIVRQRVSVYRAAGLNFKIPGLLSQEAGLPVWTSLRTFQWLCGGISQLEGRLQPRCV